MCAPSLPLIYACGHSPDCRTQSLSQEQGASGAAEKEGICGTRNQRGDTVVGVQGRTEETEIFRW